MRRILVLIFIFSSILSFSQDPIQEKKKKHSIGIFVSPIAFTAWYTDYNVIYDEQKSGYRRRYTLYSPSGIAYQYELSNAAKIQIGLSSTFENQLFYNLHSSDNLIKIVDYKVHYLNIPLNVRLFPSHFGISEVLGGFFIQIGMNLDIITNEHIISSKHSPIDLHHSIPAGYVDPNYKLEESSSAKIKFNRICPTLALGQEVVGDKITFFYGGNLQFRSIYQMHNTLEYFKNIKFSLINIGLSYRF